jgi:predicted nucleic acid-binding protein
VKPRFLIDTDWSIDYLQGKPETTARVADLLRRKVLALSIVCLAELYEGVIYSRDPARRERALNQFVCRHFEHVQGLRVESL